MQFISKDGYISVYKGDVCLYHESLNYAYNQSFIFTEMIRIYKDDLSVTEDRLATAREVERKQLEYHILWEKQRVEKFIFLSTHTDEIVLAYENYMKQT